MTYNNATIHRNADTATAHVRRVRRDATGSAHARAESQAPAPEVRPVVEAILSLTGARAETITRGEMAALMSAISSLKYSINAYASRRMAQADVRRVWPDGAGA